MVNIERVCMYCTWPLGGKVFLGQLESSCVILVGEIFHHQEFATLVTYSKVEKLKGDCKRVIFYLVV
jgi:hypothetical protein